MTSILLYSILNGYELMLIGQQNPMFSKIGNCVSTKQDEYGIAFVKNVPANAEATETLGRRISFIRETHYGTFWDFTANNAHADTAYTEFTGKGGMSLYVDGFNAANRLHEIAPEHYNLLSTVRVPTHSAGDPSTVIAPTPRAFPILNLDPVSGKLFQVRFNNDDRSVLGGRALLDKNGSTVDVAQFYDALRTWVGILRDPEFELWIQLTPGLVVIVDNWRVLHGRSEFTGHRRVCGSYHGYDDYRSRVRDLCYGKAGRADI
ncbi:hypothetical protein HDU82_003599 [Entophlyctis luteolus]|nr:hypothetical protein HDU82_003599 [Entophlyctis luteolus]